jgi:hypothetical protein
LANQRQIELHLEGPRVSVHAFLEAARSLFTVVQEVGQAVIGPQARAVTWYITDLRGASAHMRAISEVKGKVRIADDDIDRALAEVHDGLGQLQKKAAIPRNFSDLALEAAAKLAAVGHNGVSRIEIGLGGRKVEVTQHIQVNVAEVTKEKIRTMGSIEGTIEAISVHGRKRFVLYDRQTGRAVNCLFDFDEHAIFDRPWRKRVLVRGIIWSRADGRPVSIHVSKPEDIYTFPPDDELPSALQVRGILGNG